MNVFAPERSEAAVSATGRSADGGTMPGIGADSSRTASASAPAMPCAELERLSHLAGIDPCSLTDTQIAEALFQMR